MPLSSFSSLRGVVSVPPTMWR